MATVTQKVLGQSKPSAATLTDAYTVPAATQCTISTITVCNQSATPTSFRIQIAPGGAASATSQYMYFDVAIGGNDTFACTFGITLGAGDVVRVYNGLASCSFGIYGVETS